MKTVDPFLDSGILAFEMAKQTKKEFIGGNVDAEVVQAVKSVAIKSPIELNVQERIEFFLRKGLIAHKKESK